ncbi:serine/threonine protein kinase [Streptomyces triticagri]|uniref:Serine/threonine protein kinase n=1 Tax=Streptomyces triticagri TaxID=2293568 RepID=A0A372M3E8_9ACTN|nr:serine/threonine-protein kinase [Streptomyces triticagri]RFU84827.1 serine/threonine protein kinase [Streptomyces triticagri]
MSGDQPASSDEVDFHGYTLKRRLGAGGMGVVHLATHPDLSHPVAVKVMRPELADDPGFRARFSREIAAALRVQGLHTVRVVDAGTAEGRPYLVTEYVDGPTLSEIMAAGPLGSGTVRLLARSLAVALYDIHDTGIVHRDLKPANVLMGAGVIKVIDFGIAQLADASTILTDSGATIGTTGYMAPEQIRGTPGPATDVFAWAATVAHAATGRPPFGTGPTDAVIYRILHDEPDLDGVPPGLDGPLRAAMAKDPAQRPTAAELIAMLDGHIPAAPAMATASTAPVRQPPPTRRFPAPAPIPASAAPPAAPPAPASVVRRPRTAGRRLWWFLAVLVVLAVVKAGLGQWGGASNHDAAKSGGVEPSTSDDAAPGHASTESPEPAEEAPEGGEPAPSDTAPASDCSMDFEARPHKILGGFDVDVTPDCPTATPWAQQVTVVFHQDAYYSGEWEEVDRQEVTTIERGSDEVHSAETSTDAECGTWQATIEVKEKETATSAWEEVEYEGGELTTDVADFDAECE